MAIQYLLSGAVCCLLMIYLVYTLIRPERF